MSTAGDKAVDTDKRRLAKPPKLMHACVYCGRRTWGSPACSNCSDLLEADPVMLARGNGNGDEAA